MLDELEYQKIIGECFELSKKKNKDYGSEVLLTFGSKGILVRMHDKISRMKNLLWDNKNPAVESEKIEDTAKDLINYTIYLIMSERKTLK